MIDTLLRQWTLLQLIPRHPRRIDPARLKARLDGMGLAVTLRTVQRDLNALALTFPWRPPPAGPRAGAGARGRGRWTSPAWTPMPPLTFHLVEQHLQPLLPPTTLADLAPWFEAARGVVAAEVSRVTQWQHKVRVVARTPDQTPTRDRSGDPGQPLRGPAPGSPDRGELLRPRHRRGDQDLSGASPGPGGDGTGAVPGVHRAGLSGPALPRPPPHRRRPGTGPAGPAAHRASTSTPSSPGSSASVGVKPPEAGAAGPGHPGRLPGRDAPGQGPENPAPGRQLARGPGQGALTPSNCATGSFPGRRCRGDGPLRACGRNCVRALTQAAAQYAIQD